MVQFPKEAIDFSLFSSVRPGPVAHPASYPLSTQAGGSFPAVKWPGSEYYHGSPSSDDVKNEWSYTAIQ